MLTPEKAREAYQSAIPARREEFERTAKQCAADASHKNFIQQYYATEIMRLAKDELRLRLQMARDRVKQLIDSGWEPNEMQSVRSVYTDMFSQYNHGNRNSFDDMYATVSDGLTHLGVAGGIAPTREQHQVYVLEFSQYQVDVSTEFTHDLEFYMAAKQPSNQNTTHLTLQGNVNFLQTGGISHVTQNIEFNSVEAVVALRKLKESIDTSEEPYANALNSLVDRALVESQKDGASWVSLGRSLDGFQNLVRTAGAVPSAYNLLAGLAAAHGFHLPRLPS